MLLAVRTIERHSQNLSCQKGVLQPFKLTVSELQVSHLRKLSHVLGWALVMLLAVGLLRINERTHRIAAGSWSPRGLLFQCVHATTANHLPCQSVVSSASMVVSSCCPQNLLLAFNNDLVACWAPSMTPYTGPSGLLVAVTFGFGIALFWAIAPFVILNYYLNCVASICLF